MKHKMQKKFKRVGRDLIYDKNINPENLNKEYEIILKYIGGEKKILEFGCHGGHFTRLLVDRGCKVTGVEIDKIAAEKAKNITDEIIIGNVEDENVFKKINGKYDVILCMHILEHLVDPWHFLAKIRQYLKSNGRVIIAIPNVACWPIRINLFLKGIFEYTEIGILDKTHLRFFTFNTTKKLIGQCGFYITNWEISLEKVPFYRRLASIPVLDLVGHYWRTYMLKRYPNLCGAVFIFVVKPIKAQKNDE